MALENISPEQILFQLGDKISTVSYWLLRALGAALIIWIVFRLISALHEHKKIRLLKEINARLENIEKKLIRKK